MRRGFVRRGSAGGVRAVTRRLVHGLRGPEPVRLVLRAKAVYWLEDVRQRLAGQGAHPPAARRRRGAGGLRRLLLRRAARRVLRRRRCRRRGGCRGRGPLPRDGVDHKLRRRLWRRGRAVLVRLGHPQPHLCRGRRAHTEARELTRPGACARRARQPTSAGREDGIAAARARDVYNVGRAVLLLYSYLIAYAFRGSSSNASCDSPTPPPGHSRRDQRAAARWGRAGAPRRGQAGGGSGSWGEEKAGARHVREERVADGPLVLQQGLVQLSVRRLNLRVDAAPRGG